MSLLHEKLIQIITEFTDKICIRLVPVSRTINITLRFFSPGLMSFTKVSDVMFAEQHLKYSLEVTEVVMRFLQNLLKTIEYHHISIIFLNVAMHYTTCTCTQIF